MRFDATGEGAAIAATTDAPPLRTFTIETWFVRVGRGKTIADVPAGGTDPTAPTAAGALLQAIPLAARGTLDRSPASNALEPADRIGWLLGIDAVDDVLIAAFHDGSGALHRIAGRTTLTEGSWHHAATTFDGEAFRLYLDGHLEAALPAAVVPDASGRSPIALGTSVTADGLTAHGAFDGILDETRLWSTARTATEIGADMRTPIDAGAVGLVAGWSMDEPANSILEGGSDPSVRLLLRGATTWLDSPVPDPTPPPAPGALMAVPNGGAITLGWTAVQADDLAGYRIRRTSGVAVDPAAAPLGGWTPIDATAFLDESAEVGLTYRYVVAAVDRYGNESDPSPVATAALVASPGEPASDPSGDPSSAPVGPDPSVFPTGVTVDHVMIGRPGDGSSPASYGPQDAPLAGIGRFAAFRVRFRIENRLDAAVALTPTLEVRDLGGGQPAQFTTVPPGRATPGAPVYTSREWVPVREEAAGSGPPGTIPGGSVLGGETGTIAVPDLRTSGNVAETLTPVAGLTAAGRNPAGVLDLPPGSFSEVEFSVRATADAPYGARFAFRLSDGEVAVAGEAVATVELGPPPALLLSPGQRQGLAVGGPADEPAVQPVVGRAAGASTAGGILYRLAPVAGASDVAADGPAEVHGGAASGSGTCAVCHDTHAAGGRSLLTRSGPQATVCFACHDSAGTGATTPVESQYLDPAVPADDPATASFFRHDALAVGTDHSLAARDEFAGRLDRHAECADCHDPHSTGPADSIQTAGGWTASGRLGGPSGVAVVNGPAGSEPSYTFVDGTTAEITFEYQLCFKCHSGFTTLPARQPDHPSRWTVDKALELNPDNASYHPIEAAGRNGSDAMIASLGGTSPYKLWEFSPDSTIRCLNCHGDSRLPRGPTTPAGSDLAPHTTASIVAADGAELNRGLLIQPYRDRTLKGSSDPYDPQDSALCLSCHGQAPFVDTTGNARSDTAFRFHGLHVAGLAGKGAIAGDIDTPNAGLGNALCSECHYRIHSTASRNDFRTTTPQTGTDGGLVVFAPNVRANDPADTPLSGVIDWARTGPSAGTCTLTCHGKDHPAASY